MTKELRKEIQTSIKSKKKYNRNATEANKAYNQLMYMGVLFCELCQNIKKYFNLIFINRKIYSWIVRLLLNTVGYVLCQKSSWNLRLLNILVNTLTKYQINFYKDLLYKATFCQELGIAIHKAYLLWRTTVKLTIKIFCQTIQTNSLVTKRKTSFTASEPHIKKYDQTALDYLKRQNLTEVTQEITKM